VMNKPGVLDLRNLVNEGLALHRNGQLKEADEIYSRVLGFDPDHADALHLSGMIAYQTGRLDAAVTLISRAIGAHPRAASYHSNLGNVLQAKDLLADAADSYRRALAFNPGLPETHLNLGNVLQELGDANGALIEFRRALALAPGLAEARVAESMLLLLQGDFAQGWQNFEDRWRTRDYDTPSRSYPRPLWNGEPSTAGPVLVWGEQGVGDEIMFAGLVPDAIRTGTALTLECDRRLVPLFQRSFPAVSVVARGDPDQAGETVFAAHSPSGSLPRLFRTSPAAFENTVSPYLSADPAARSRFRDRYFDGRRLVGLAWYTRASKTGHKRSIHLEQLKPWFEVPDLRWISLQYGGHDALKAQADAARTPILVDRSLDQLTDIDGFAAQVASLDLVITIDNSTAHLAAALGVATWLLLPFAPNWRWLLETDRSPWYSTMRIFRQANLGDWSAPVAAIQNALVSWAQANPATR
jgi:Tfp pilus assembly protein PilF